MVSERLVRRLLIFVSLIGLAAGAGAVAIGHPDASHAIWAAATLPVAVALAFSIARDLAAGRLGVDVIALLAMSAALALGQPLAGIVVAIMYTGGTVLEDYAVARAERSLKALVDRAPRVAHRRLWQAIEDVAIAKVKIGDAILVRAGEIIPVDGIITSTGSVFDKSALTASPFPSRGRRESVRSGTVNAGGIRASCGPRPPPRKVRTPGSSASSAQSTGQGPLHTSGGPLRAALAARDPYRGRTCLACFRRSRSGAFRIGGCYSVSAYPRCPGHLHCRRLQRRKTRHHSEGGAALDALARTHTVLFDKTGTLTVGGARLIAVETAPGESADESYAWPARWSRLRSTLWLPPS